MECLCTCAGGDEPPHTIQETMPLYRSPQLTAPAVAGCTLYRKPSAEANGVRVSHTPHRPPPPMDSTAREHLKPNGSAEVLGSGSGHTRRRLAIVTLGFTCQITLGFSSPTTNRAPRNIASTIILAWVSPM